MQSLLWEEWEESPLGGVEKALSDGDSLFGPQEELDTRRRNWTPGGVGWEESLLEEWEESLWEEWEKALLMGI